VIKDIVARMNSRDIASLVPDPDDLLKLTVEEQGRLVLKLLAGHDTPRNPVAHSNFFSRGDDYANRPKYGNRQSEVDAALPAAWSWLENHGHLAKAPSAGGGKWFFVTRTGKQLGSQDDAAAYRKANLLPKDRLHPAMAEKVYGAFLRGHYDAAIFQAFLEIEVAVRTAGGFPQDLVGDKLMRAAFAPAKGGQHGSLTDTTLQSGEQEAMSDLFAGAFGLYRNSTGHRHVPTEPGEAAEVIMFASQLLRIVDRSSGSTKS
jgi:uncharacterized protein (TIGR02391 family)